MVAEPRVFLPQHPVPDSFLLNEITGPDLLWECSIADSLQQFTPYVLEKNSPLLLVGEQCQ